MQSTAPTKTPQVALLEERGWTRVDRAGNEWSHPKREGVVYTLNAAYRREQRLPSASSRR